MLLVLDANVLVEDPELGRPIWDELRQASSRGFVTIVVPRIAVQETTAIVQQFRLDQAPKRLRMKSPPPVQSALQAARDAVQSWALSYDAFEVIAASSIKVIQTPATPHDELALRAINRRAPFSADGGGYRDTLHWYALLEAAKEMPDMDVVLVSRDNAYAKDEVLHPELRAEAAEVLGRERVMLCRDLETLAFPGRFKGIAHAFKITKAEVTDLVEVVFSSGPVADSSLWYILGLTGPEEAYLSQPSGVSAYAETRQELVEGGWLCSVMLRLNVKLELEWTDALSDNFRQRRVHLLVTYRTDKDGRVLTVDAVEVQGGDARPLDEAPDVVGSSPEDTPQPASAPTEAGRHAANNSTTFERDTRDELRSPTLAMLREARIAAVQAARWSAVGDQVEPAWKIVRDAQAAATEANRWIMPTARELDPTLTFLKQSQDLANQAARWGSVASIVPGRSRRPHRAEESSEVSPSAGGEDAEEAGPTTGN